jgi:hypothetical protein
MRGVFYSGYKKGWHALSDVLFIEELEVSGIKRKPKPCYHEDHTPFLSKTPGGIVSRRGTEECRKFTSVSNVRVICSHLQKGGSFPFDRAIPINQEMITGLQLPLSPLS